MDRSKLDLNLRRLARRLAVGAACPRREGSFQVPGHFFPGEAQSALEDTCIDDPVPPTAGANNAPDLSLVLNVVTLLDGKSGKALEGGGAFGAGWRTRRNNP